MATTNETTGPTVTFIDRNGEHASYRISGGEVAPEWRRSLRHGEAPWCEFTTWGSGPERHVGSYGGTVWPTAWPDLFVALPSSAAGGSGGVALTDAGAAAIAKAEAR